MTRIRVERTIEAPVDVVFKAVTDIENLPETNPDVISVELLTDPPVEVGTRFRETRSMGKGRELVTELEVTEFIENECARMVADSHGTVWDTTFRFRPSGDGTTLEIDMDARAHKLLPKLLNPIMKGFFRKGMVKHLGTLAAYCEWAASSDELL